MRNTVGYFLRLRHPWNAPILADNEVVTYYDAVATKEEQDGNAGPTVNVPLETASFVREKDVKNWVRLRYRYKYISISAHVKRVTRDEYMTKVTYRSVNVYCFSSAAQGKTCIECKQSLIEGSGKGIIQVAPGRLCAICNYNEVAEMSAAGIEKFKNVEL